MTALNYALNDGIAVLSMDDGKANALGPDMLDALEAALDRAEGEAKALVLFGRPGRFCGGFDLKVMMSSQEAARNLVTRGAEVLLRIYGSSLPTVIACTGHAIAAGSIVLLVGDSRIGAEGDFKIGLNETAIGMQLPIMGQELARDRLDPRYLTRAVIQAELFSPFDAVTAGYLDHVVVPDELVSAAMAEAKRLSALVGHAYAGTKKVLRAATIKHVQDTLEADIARLSAPIS